MSDEGAAAAQARTCRVRGRKRWHGLAGRRSQHPEDGNSHRRGPGLQPGHHAGNRHTHTHSRVHTSATIGLTSNVLPSLGFLYSFLLIVGKVET